MASTNEHIKTINKVDSDIPSYLDFEKLRVEGIAHLGKLSGKIWTDHNVHDPGITILEVLCYALLDLGYKTNLPIQDLLTKNPQDNSPENNFFTAAQILTCNPLTIIDYRKLLIDIDGVRNAWIEIATDQLDFCRNENQTAILDQSNNKCVTYLNGLYHVYIDSNKNRATDFASEEDANTYFNELSKRIKQKLMEHRNFCEDFIDITYLCHLEVGVCMDVELHEQYDMDVLYPQIIQALRDFMTPTVKFYTLQELLDRGNAIEDIFAGRPYPLPESHGFIDNQELEQIHLKKEIHLSDVYQVILGIEGVKSVDNLLLKNCQDGELNTYNSWKFKIPKNHTLDFSLTCTQVQFRKKGIPQTFDASKFEGIFQINFSHDGKVTYLSSSAYLDHAIPSAVYHEDLDEYFLLQDEFPKVYGIAEGGLPDNASNHRKAQALQLKAYLLFFDQVLAGYLTQLSHIRQLFAMDSPTDPSLQRTYFLNELSDMPELAKLLKFATGMDSKNTLGEEGSTLVRPVSKQLLNEMISSEIADNAWNDFNSFYYYKTLLQQEVAVNQFKEDFINNTYSYGFINENSKQVYYFILGTSDDIALLSTLSFPSKDAAFLHLNAVAYVGSFEENYRSFISNENQVSFDMELNMATFKSYLAMIIEDKDEYVLRRNTFLNHLLARFAEQMSDHVIDQYAAKSRIDQQNRQMQAKENLLSNYPEISANRAKGYNYLENNWNKGNSSGFEKEAKYLAGISNKAIHSLCNFIVEPLDDYFLVELQIAEEPYFSLTERFDSEAEAEEAAKMVFDAIAESDKLITKYNPVDKLYRVELRYQDNKTVPFYKQYATSQEADEARIGLNRMFSKTVTDDVYISSYTHQVLLVNSEEKSLRSSITSYDSIAEALEVGKKGIAKINDEKIWLNESKEKEKLTQLQLNPYVSDEIQYMDIKDFKININNNILGKPDLFTYDVLDKSNSFKFYAAKDFKSNKEAKSHAIQVLLLAAQAEHYLLDKKNIDDALSLHVVQSGIIEATCYSTFNSETEAIAFRDHIIAELNKSAYRLKTLTKPKGWKFNYALGYDAETNFNFTSSKEYLVEKDAIQASRAFQQAIPSLTVASSKIGPILKQLNKSSKLPTVLLSAEVDGKDKQLERALMEQKSTLQYAMSTKTQSFKSAVRKETSENEARFIYKLVDKDNVIAVYQESFETKKEALFAKLKVAKYLKRTLNVLQLCLAGNIIHEISTQKGKNKSYRYQIKAHNLSYKNTGPIAEEIILFESVTKYNSSQEALQAFENNYLKVVELACQAEQYGKSISFDENNEGNPAALVFIPIQTQQELATYQEGSVQEILQRLLMSYPIQELNGLFYFSTFDSGKNPEAWRSMKAYATAEDAMQAFQFFVMLRKYSGNLFVDCDPETGTYKIYIREVLAESIDRFYTEELAWGEQGVEKFICGMQSDIGLHRFQKQENCCYSFYLNCGPDFLIHPCTYDTAKKRNQVMLDLYEQFKINAEKKAYTFHDENNYLVLNDRNGNAFAKKRFEPINENDPCNLLFNILEEFGQNTNSYTFENNLVLLKDQTGKILLESYNSDWTINSFREELVNYLCFFPIIRTKNAETNAFQYQIEIKLPGFHPCQDDNLDPCGCDNQQREEEPTCYVAWKTSCSISSCSEAIQKHFIANLLLSNFENYKPELDCACNSFGISLNLDLNLGKKYLAEQQANRPLSNLSGLTIAYNPQCYNSAKELCQAVDRTKDRTSPEGLHAIEHILLRPRCPEDCEDQQNHYCSSSMMENKLTWDPESLDPCADEPIICFSPESDPYSCISTVVLPAWPKRFNTKSGRMFMEDLLHRIAPAHVMLRILWLAPHDFCCFEIKYKGWRRYLAKKNNCQGQFSRADFLEFLWYRNFEELSDCQTCLPCEESIRIDNPCLNRESMFDNTPTTGFLDQVNQTFCWRVSIPGEYQFIPCNRMDRGMDTEVKKEKASRLNEAENTTALKTVSIKKSNPKQFKELLEKRSLIYRKTVDQIADKTNKHAIVNAVQRFLREEPFNLSMMEGLISRIIENKKTSTKNPLVLNKPQINRLIESVISYALDQMHAKKNKRSKTDSFEQVFEKLRKSKIDVSAIYNHWDGTELKKYKPEINVLAIKKILLGTK